MRAPVPSLALAQRTTPIEAVRVLPAAIDMQHIEARRFQVAEVARQFSVPAAQVGGVARGGAKS